MTREEASNILDDYDVNFDGHTAEEIAEAFEVAFRALEQEPCDNAVSRQAVLDIVDSYSDSQSNVEDVTQDIISDIVALPPVNPQPKTGKWIDSPNGYFTRCSECGLHGDKGIYKHYGWCPKCGAKMVELKESEDRE